MPLELDDLISSGNYKLVKHRLDRDKTVDLLEDGGRRIKLAIKSKNVELVGFLFQYFKDNQLSEYPDVQSYESVILRNKIRSAIEGVLDRVTLSKKMQDMLSQYVNFDSDEHDDAQDIDVVHYDAEGLSDQHHELFEESSGRHSASSTDLAQGAVGLPVQWDADVLPTGQSGEIGDL